MARRHVLGLTAATALLVAGSLSAQGGEKTKVLFLRGGGIHDWKTSTQVLVPVFEKTGDFEITLTENLDDLNTDNLAKYNLVLFHTTSITFTQKEQAQALCDFVRNGGGWAGIHSVTDSFKNSDAYWEMVGGRFAGHGGGKFTVYILDKDHPITKGMEDFEIQDETYAHTYHKNSCIRALLRMDKGNERQCMGWVQDYGKGRVFYSGLGHGKEAWTNPAWQRFFVRGMYWAAGREPKDPQP
jgi:type 1 glutamine amidotransferase